MRILVDTHVFLWALAEPERLSPKKRSELENRANAVYLSSISVAEILIKASLGKLEFNHDPIACAEELGFEPLDFSSLDAILLRKLPFHHRDPFDRMLVAQSLAQNMKLMSDDRNFAPYACELI